MTTVTNKKLKAWNDGLDVHVKVNGVTYNYPDWLDNESHKEVMAGIGAAIKDVLENDGDRSFTNN